MAAATDFGRGWVEAYPSYNDHLIYDYGAYTLGALVIEYSPPGETGVSLS